MFLSALKPFASSKITKQHIFLSNGKQAEQSAHCGVSKCGGLRRLPGPDTAEEDLKVFTLFLLRLHRVVFQT